jgi:lipoprotein-anchoring transpeptidase ErfK/SrfK
MIIAPMEALRRYGRASHTSPLAAAVEVDMSANPAAPYRKTRAAVTLAFATAGLLAAHAPAEAAREHVTASLPYPAGTIVIAKHERRLYLTLGDGTALRYPIAVGMSGKAWTGWARVDGKYDQPAWAPPAEVKRDHPELGYVPGGSPHNPMGARALTLDRDQIAIHGTTASMRKSVGSAASYGCIRMYNEDVVDLFDRVAVGTNVVAVP